MASSLAMWMQWFKDSCGKSRIWPPPNRWGGMELAKVSSPIFLIDGFSPLCMPNCQPRVGKKGIFPQFFLILVFSHFPQFFFIFPSIWSSGWAAWPTGKAWPHNWYTGKETIMTDLEMIAKEWHHLKTLDWIHYQFYHIVSFLINRE